MPQSAFSMVHRREPVRRVYGIESELMTPEEPQCFSHVLYGNLLPGITRADSFLSNGARLYLDVGQHVEYSAPEAQTIREAVAALAAGEILLSKTAETWRQKQSDNSPACAAAFNTRVIDDEFNTWGSHESYLTKREIVPHEDFVSKPLASFLATRSLFAGVGLIPGGSFKEEDYKIAQKIWAIKRTVSGTTVHDKPLVNTRDEPLAAVDQYRRLHLVAGDPAQSPWAMAYRLGSTSLVLRMIEHGVDLSDFIFLDPVEAAKQTASFLGWRTNLDLANGKKTNAVEHQLALAELALGFTENVPVPADEKIVAREWYEAAQQFKNCDDYEVLGDRVDWAAKLSLMMNDRPRHSEEQKARFARAVDLLYGELSIRGLALKLRQRGHFKDPLKAMKLAPDAEAMPPSGRARLRGALVDRLARLRSRRLAEDIKVDWATSRWKLKKQKFANTVLMRNPYGEDLNEIIKIEEHFAEIDRMVA